MENPLLYLIIKKYSDKHYAVTLKLALTTGGKVELRRDYFDIDEEECIFPNGALKDLQNKGHHFAFGIYPFVRSKSYENIYKVLFYIIRLKFNNTIKTHKLLKRSLQVIEP